MNLDFSNVYDKKRLLSVATEKQIYEHILQEKLKLGDWYCSVVRPPGVVDNNPSLQFTILNGKICWKDWGYGLSGDVIDFMRHYYREFTMAGAIKKFLSEYNNPKDMTIYEEKKVTKRLVTYTIKPFGQRELLYWNQAGVLLSDLNFYDTVLVDKVYDKETGDLLFYSSLQSPIFCAQKLGIMEQSFQLYRPFEVNKHRKFRNQFCEDNIVFGLNRLLKEVNGFKTRILIITKSNKDMITINSAGIDSVGVTSESILMNEMHIKSFKYVYGDDNIYTWFDNDEAGIKLSSLYKRRYNTRPLFVPHQFAQKAKDPFDFAKYYRAEFENKILELLK